MVSLSFYGSRPVLSCPEYPRPDGSVGTVEGFDWRPQPPGNPSRWRAREGLRFSSEAFEPSTHAVRSAGIRDEDSTGPASIKLKTNISLVRFFSASSGLLRSPILIHLRACRAGEAGVAKASSRRSSAARGAIKSYAGRGRRVIPKAL